MILDSFPNLVKMSECNCTTGTKPPCATDFDHNGVIDIDDLVTLITHWGG